MPEIKKNLRIAVDLGSSSTHVGLVDAGAYVCLMRKDIPSEETAARLPAAIGAVRKRADSSCKIPVIIAGTHRESRRHVEKILKKCRLSPVLRLSCSGDLPLKFRYRNTDKLGADRIADALYAAVRYKGSNVIVIDSGTATTVNLISNKGEFLGGAIMPGAAVQLASLHAATLTLPLLRPNDRAVPVIGASTAGCMQAGVVQGIAGGLNHLVRTYQSMLGGKCVVLATGGGWRLLRKYASFGATYIPDLTLIGTALYPLRGKAS